MENLPKAIIFDMNGVIIDDEHIHEMAFVETVKPFNIQLTHQDYLECCAGQTDIAGYEQIANKYSTKLPIHELLKQKSQMYLKLFPTNKKSYSGVIDLIHLLSKETILALTSSSSRDEVDLITREFGVNGDFKITVSANDVVHGKPDPEPYLITAKKLNIDPKYCVVVEDSASGVKSAKSAGMKVVAITTTHTKEELVVADKVIDSFLNLSLSDFSF